MPPENWKGKIELQEIAPSYHVQQVHVVGCQTCNSISCRPVCCMRMGSTGMPTCNLVVYLCDLVGPCAA